jgi:hypothetical protein
MASEWDVVEDKPLSEWDVVSVAPAAPQRGVPRAIGAPETPRAAPKAPTFGEKVKGAVETALEMVAQFTGGAVGMVGGTVGGLAGALRMGEIGTPQGAQRVEETAMEGAERGAQFVRGGMGPMADPAQRSQAGQEMIGAVNETLGLLPALAAGPRGMVGMSGKQETGLQPALRAAGDVTGAVVDKATPRLSPNNLARASTAVDAGIPVSPHQLSGNKFLRLLGEAAEDIPMAGGTTLKRNRKERFSAGLVRAIDPESTATVLDDATFRSLQDTAGQRIGEIAGRTDVPVESFGDLLDVARRDTPDVQAVISAYAKDLARIAEENGGKVPGDVLRKLRTEAQTQERGARASKGDLANALERFTRRLDDALAENAPEGDMPALLDARRQYAISKALEPLVAAYPTGEFPPTRLKALVTNTKEGKRRMARGESGELGDYARLGTELLREMVTSNTAERNLVFRVAGDAAAAAKIGVTYPFAGIYNFIGPRMVKRVVEAQRKREAPLPEQAPPEPGLAQGFEDVPQGRPPPAEPPLGDLTPDWETAPGAAPDARTEVVPTEGLVPAVDEVQPMRPRQAGAALEESGAGLRGAGDQIPAVEGRPDLPDTMVAGAPAEVAATDATGAAMQAPDAALARREQMAELERVRMKVDTPEVAKVLEEHAKDLAKQAAIQAEKDRKLAGAKKLREAAGYTTDPALKERLLKRALALEADEKVPAGKATEGAPATPPVKEPKRPLPTGKATEVPVETIVAEDPSIPVGDAVEVMPDVVEVGDAQRLESDGVQPAARAEVVQEDGGAGAKKAETQEARYEALKRKLNEEGLSSAEYAEMERIDPAKASPEEATAAAKRIGVPESWMQERRHMLKAGRSDAEIKTQHAWEQANDRLMNAYDWTMAGREAENAIRERVQQEMTPKGGRKARERAEAARTEPYQQEFNRRVIEAMNAEAQRLETEANTPGTLANKRRAKKDEDRQRQTAEAMNRATQEEIRLVSDELDQMRAQGRITESEMQALAERIKREATDLEDALDIADELLGKKNAGALRQGVVGKGEAANTKFEVGQTYVDANGNKAVYQADGTWKPVK